MVHGCAWCMVVHGAWWYIGKDDSYCNSFYNSNIRNLVVLAIVPGKEDGVDLQDDPVEEAAVEALGCGVACADHLGGWW